MEEGALFLAAHAAICGSSSTKVEWEGIAVMPCIKVATWME